MRAHVFTIYVLALCILLATVTASGEDEMTLSMKSGLAPNQVLQCDENDTAMLECSGETTPGVRGTLEGRIVSSSTPGQVVLDWRVLRRNVPHRWVVRIKDIPVGGPYTLELCVRDDKERAVCSQTIAPFFVGDIWLLGGQSNMAGAGNITDVTPPNERVMVFAMNDNWRQAEEPLHRLAEGRYFAYNPSIKGDVQEEAIPDVKGPFLKGAGIGLPFADEIAKATGRPIGLVPCAVGGTSMDQWSPALKKDGGRSLYGAMLARFHAVGGKAKGLLWYQGEAEAGPEAAAVFQSKFVAFAKALRDDFDAPQFPIYYVQIGRFILDPNDGMEPSWSFAQQVQLDCEPLIQYGGMVPSVDLELDDLIHMNTQSSKKLAQRLAKQVLRDLYGGAKIENGPRPQSAVWVDTPYGPTIRVTFKGVNGRLLCNGRLSGFRLCDADKNTLPVVYNQQVATDAPDTVVLWISNIPEMKLTVAEPEKTFVYYGRSRNPYCNLTDEQDMGTPAFGPLPVTKNAAP